MSMVSKILTIGGVAITTLGVSLGAAEGSPGLLAMGLGCLLFVVGVFKDIKSEKSNYERQPTSYSNSGSNDKVIQYISALQQHTTVQRQH